MKKIILIVVILGAITVVLFLPKNSENTRESLTGLEIASDAFIFLNKTIKPEGGFYHRYTCNDEYLDECFSEGQYEPAGHAQVVRPPHFGHLTLAFYDMWKKTGNTEYQEEADKAVEFILASCEKEIDYCLWNFFPFMIYYNETKDIRYKDAILRTADNFLKEKSLAENLALNAGPKFKVLFDMTGNNQYLDFLKKDADAIITGALNDTNPDTILYKEANKDINTQIFKAVWSHILPAYGATKDTKYLTYAGDFFHQAKISEHIGELKIPAKLQLIIHSLDSLIQLASLDTERKDFYLKEAHELAQYAYITYADTPENKKFDANYGFIDNGVKDSLTNGWLVRQYLKLSDDTFLTN